MRLRTCPARANLVLKRKKGILSYRGTRQLYYDFIDCCDGIFFYKRKAVFVCPKKNLQQFLWNVYNLHSIKTAANALPTSMY